MRKVLICILTILLFLVSTGCNSNKVSYNPELPPVEVDDYKQYLNETFNSRADLSSCQGYRNWYYYCGDPEDQLSLMTYNSFYGRWCSKYNTTYTDTFMWGVSWLPDHIAGAGVGMGFKAPATGKIDVYVMVRLLAPQYSNSGDGVLFVISNQVGDMYDSISIRPQDGGKDMEYEETIEVEKGDEILFMLYGNLNNTNDVTDVDITINYVD